MKKLIDSGKGVSLKGAMSTKKGIIKQKVPSRLNTGF